MQNKFVRNDIYIEPNLSDYWEFEHSSKDLICISQGEDEYTHVYLTLKDAEFVRDSLNEIVEFYDKMPRKGNHVRITKGRFEGLTGDLYDIDHCDRERPLAIRIHDTKEIETCHYYCNWDYVEKI